MSIKKLITQVLVVFLVLSMFTSSFPIIMATFEKNGSDGFWTMTFRPEDAGTNVTLTNCTIDDGAITLNYSTAGRIYDFTKSDNHQAYCYQTIFFSTMLFNPDRHTRNEFKFDAYPHIRNIKYPDDDLFTQLSSDGLKKYVVHHFRFKINPDTIDSLDIIWKGKADNDVSTHMFYWKRFPTFPSFGFWFSLTQATSNGSSIELFHNLPKVDILDSVNEDNYFDICVVCKPKGLSCTLFTDYVKLFSTAENSYDLGSAFAETTNPIDPYDISNTEKYYWESLSWEDYERSGATATYQVLYWKASGEYVLVEEEFLPGNKDGFTDSPVSLSSVPFYYKRLKIRANLTTTIETASPKIYSWTLTWQTWKKTLHWQDLFYSDYRVDVKRRATLGSGNVSINPVTGTWPMFGQNPQNTRVSEGKGPLSSELNWFSSISEDNSLTNAVISEGKLYVTFDGSKDIYFFNDISVNPPPDDEISYTQKYAVSDADKDIFAAPTIADDYLIVVTGSEASGGTSNYIYALDRENNLQQKWKFSYDEDICYQASPAVFEDKVFVTSWSGDTNLIQSNTNNKLIALSLYRHGDLSNDDALWIFDLPTKSVSTPAVYDDIVVVACNKDNGDSIFAVDSNTGDVIWNQSVGAVGKASPVIYDDIVFIMSSTKKLGSYHTMVHALDINDGRILWSQTINIALKQGLGNADSTPAVFNDVLYVASPNGKVVALNVSDGSTKWSRQIYTVPVTSDTGLVFSPAFADDVIYIGTPEGNLFSLKASNGENAYSMFTTFRPEFENVPIVTSPVVSNGLVFFGDANGLLYSLGSFRSPTEEISGYIISNPIILPKNYWWNSFFAEYSIPSESDSTIVFSLLDKDMNVIKTIQNGSSILVENKTLDRVIRLRADFSADNISVNPKLLKWNVTFQTDQSPPVFIKSSFIPNPDGWLNITTPTCSIRVYDNDTGLVVTSAVYTIEYTLSGSSTVLTKALQAACPGSNGTHSAVLTANISKLAFSRNITSLKSIYFSVRDLANNRANSTKVTFRQDITKPSSKVNTHLNNTIHNTSTVFVNATASDPGGSSASGIAQVELLYRFSRQKTFSGAWKSFGSVANSTKPKWNITAKDGGGYYELTTRATDKTGNQENVSEKGLAVILFDNTAPGLPDFDDEYSSKELPRFTIEFSDDFRLHSIWYRPNFESTWTLIESEINSVQYAEEWMLESEFWDRMEEGKTYYLFFRLNDTLDNIRLIESESQGLKLVRDSVEPVVDIDIPSLDFQWNPSDTFNITALASDLGSGLKQVELFYRYSDDNNFDDVSWESFGQTLQNEPFSWLFTGEEGNGYYEFYIRAEDLAGNTAESKVFSTGIHIFPVDIVLIMAVLIAAFVLIAGIILIMWRRKKTT